MGMSKTTTKRKLRSQDFAQATFTFKNANWFRGTRRSLKW